MDTSHKDSGNPRDKNSADGAPSRHFIQQIIDEDNRTGKFQGRVHTRFPPEPNGYLHIGHAKSICLNFGLAQEYGGKCNLRFDENLDLFRRMKAGEFSDGSRTLRAKISVDHPNVNMRDPVLYRILRATHHRTGDKWCIYPTYDWAHGQSDSIERITHSICTLEFENHRPLYEWFIQA